MAFASSAPYQPLPVAAPGVLILAPPQLQAAFVAPGSPIVQQPVPRGAPGWMQLPSVNENCPPGLEYLTLIDQLLVKQRVNVVEVTTNYTMENEYTVLNSMGQTVYEAEEESGCCARGLLGPRRPFEMKIFDNFRRPVIHAHRPFACQSFLFPCFLQTMQVMAPPDSLAGTVEQEWSFHRPMFKVKDSAGSVVLRIKGPPIVSDMYGEMNFKVLSAEGDVEVGRISKQWSGWAQETYTNADNFSISFPMDLDVKLKAVMLGACFLIDFMYFEHTSSRQEDNNWYYNITGFRRIR